jgi:hypothetical protein
LATVTLLLAVPAIRLTSEVNAQIAKTSRATLSPASAVSVLSARLSGGPVFTAPEIQKKAVPLLARLASMPGEPLVILGVAGRADGTTQHTWTVSYRISVSGDAALDLAEAEYDADTGELMRASTLCDLEGQPPVAGAERPRTLTAQAAIEEARAWLPKIGLWAAQSQAPPVVLASQKPSSGIWRVWLRGRETPGGPPLTVAISLSTKTGSLLQAAIVERAAFPSVYLPRSSASVSGGRLHSAPGLCDRASGSLL